MYCLSRSQRQTYILKQNDLGMLNKYIVECKENDRYYSELDTIQHFLKKNGVRGFVIGIRCVNQEMHITMLVERINLRINNHHYQLFFSDKDRT